MSFYRSYILGIVFIWHGCSWSQLNEALVNLAKSYETLTKTLERKSIGIPVTPAQPQSGYKAPIPSTKKTEEYSPFEINKQVALTGSDAQAFGNVARTSQEWLNFIKQNPAFLEKLEANNTKIWETIFQIQPISSTAQINGYEAQTKIDELRYGDGQATQKIYAGNANLSDFTEKKDPIEVLYHIYTYHPVFFAYACKQLLTGRQVEAPYTMVAFARAVEVWKADAKIISDFYEGIIASVFYPAKQTGLSSAMETHLCKKHPTSCYKK